MTDTDDAAWAELCERMELDEPEVETIEVDGMEVAQQIVAALTVSCEGTDDAWEAAMALLYEFDPVATVMVLFGMLSNLVDSVAEGTDSTPLEIVQRIGIGVAKTDVEGEETPT